MKPTWKNLEQKFWICSLLLFHCVHPAPTNFGTGRNNAEGGGKLCVFLLDGFRWDYIDIYGEELPALRSFLAVGVRAKWNEPVFPSVSFANWQTISTGLYPEKHQLLGNTFYDRHEADPGQKIFLLGQPQTTKLLKWWQFVEPFWITALKAGKKEFLRFWSRCDVPFDGLRPDDCEGYGFEHSFQNVEQSFNLTADKLAEGYDLTMTHVDWLDDAGHEFGPYSPLLLMELKRVDDQLGRFLRKLDECGIGDMVNIIIVSDHGMRYTGPGSGTVFINLDDYIERQDVVNVVDSGAQAEVAVKDPGRIQTVYMRLKAAPGLNVYLRSEIPERWHYKNGKFVLDILITAQKGYLMRGLLNTEQQIPVNTNPNSTAMGVHGYDPALPDMRAIFFAKGPAFKVGQVTPSIRMVDVYQVFGRVLGIKVNPDDGQWSNVASMLRATQ